MKTKKIPAALLLFLLFFMFLLLSAVAFAGCGKKTDGAETADGGGIDEDYEFSYSGVFDENGLWKAVKALDCIEMFNYKGISVPNHIHEISDAEIEGKMGEILAAYPITGRAVENGDEVNIDYVGSIDGVEFDGGSTGGMGTNVIIGITSYIDEFLEQLIGHTPGETINVEVTFPDDYHEESLQGKDALFVTVINHITAAPSLDLTDEFVKENLFSDHGWSNISEMKEASRGLLQKSAVREYIRDYFADEVKISSVPEILIRYQEDLMMDFYQNYANSYGMELNEFLSVYVGAANAEELIESEREYNMQEAKYCLVVQAIAEDAGIVIDEGELARYFSENYGSADYSPYEQQYGLSYLKQTALKDYVLDYVAERAVLE